MHWTAETTNLTRVASLSITLSGVIKHLRVLPQADPRGSGETQEPLLSPVGAVLPLVDAPVEVVPGLWDQRSAEGYAYVVPKESEAYSEEGSPIAAVVDAVAEQAFCRELAGILMPQHGSRKDPKSVSAQRAKLRLAGVNAAIVPQ